MRLSTNWCNASNRTKPHHVDADIAARYGTAVRERVQTGKPQLLAKSASVAEAVAEPGACNPTIHLFSVSAQDLLKDPSLADEVFGPATLLVNYSDREELLASAEAFHGHLTATSPAATGELADDEDLLAILERKAGRLLVNGYPTGVEVCHAMVHGGPYPATSDGRSTSVGTQAILRFTRPVCYQDFPDEALPEELRSANPLGILRKVNGAMTRDATAAG
jgi:NADP-dependent aldehyde dehydrogenase